MWFAADDANRRKTEAFASGGGRIDMVRPGAAKCEQGFSVLFFRLNQVVLELAPLVATNMAVCKVFAFDI